MDKILAPDPLALELAPDRLERLDPLPLEELDGDGIFDGKSEAQDDKELKIQTLEHPDASGPDDPLGQLSLLLCTDIITNLYE